MASLQIEHVKRVRLLYKTILRLHRGLPTELRSIGDQYVKDEFKRHKEADTNFIPMFMTEWMNYAMTIAKQLRQQAKQPNEPILGKALTEEGYLAMNEEQIAQLYELFRETQKPRDPDDPHGVTTHPLASNFKDS